MLISSHRRLSIKKDILKNFAKFTGKQLYLGLFIIKLQDSGPQKETPTQVLSCEFYEVFKINLFTEPLRATASRCSAIGGSLSGAKPDPDFARSVIAHHCFFKAFYFTWSYLISDGRKSYLFAGKCILLVFIKYLHLILF